jgi:hypothetical protein
MDDGGKIADRSEKPSIDFEAHDPWLSINWNLSPVQFEHIKTTRD